MKIQLIKPPTDDDYEIRLGYNSLPPPLGLIYLKSNLKGFDHSIEIIDGNKHKLPDIITRIDANVVGCSDLYTSHKNALAILKYAKEQGSTTILGGNNASNLAHLIHKKYGFIDYVVVGDGETAFRKIIRGEEQKGLVYGVQEDLNTLPFIDLNGIEGLEQYDNRLTGYSENNLTPFPTSFIRGCIKKKRCPYCAIPYKGVRVTKPSKFWEQVSRLRQENGIRYLFETGDNFFAGSYPEKIAKAKPEGLDVSFRIYARPEDITDVSVLKKIGVSEIFLGIEHISPRIVSYIGKNHSKQSVKKAIEKLNAEGIKVHLAFLFGLMPETEESALENASFSIELTKNYKNIKRIHYTTALPLIGSKWYNTLLNNQLVREEYKRRTGNNLSTDDYPDYSYLQELSLQHFSNISFKKLQQIYSNSLRELEKEIGAEKITGFGKTKF